MTSPARRHLLPWTLIVVGALLRVAWPMDFEWKADEQWTAAAAARTIENRGAWPLVGMPSSVGVVNPGLSVWPFIGLAEISATPDGITRGVMLLNVAALFLFALWIHRAWREEDQTTGYWAVALFAVSPLPVLFSRKLWAQDLLPLLVVPWMWAHSKRERDGYAFLWGLIGILLGQLHLSGFFAAAGLLIATWLVARDSIRWKPWVAGTLCGALPLVPWIRVSAAGAAAGGGIMPPDLFVIAFKYAWGLGLDDTLGVEMPAFLDGPTIGGVATGLARWASIALVLLAASAIAIAWRNRHRASLPPTLRPLAYGALVGGALLQLTFVRMHPHYLVVWSPILFLMVAWTFAGRVSWLTATALLQLFLTVSFQMYVHEHGGAKDGDFGVTYQRQLSLRR